MTAAPTIDLMISFALGALINDNDLW